MQKLTIVAAVLAATVASAHAAPNTERTVRGTAVSSKSQTQKVSSVQPVNARKSPWVPQDQLNPGKAGSAAAFTSARNAGAAQPQTRVQTVAKARADAAPKRVASRKAVRSASRRDARRIAYRRGHARAKTQTVALQREIDTPAITGSIDRSASSGPTGSIPAMVTQMARQHGVSPALAHAVVKVESTYKPRATGKGGYIGLMQLSYQTARGMGFRGSRQALYEPRTNLTYGMKYLAGAVSKAGGSTCGAVSKYQGGHGVRGVTRAGAVYCAKVKRFMSQGVPASGRVTAEATAPTPKS